MKHLIGGISSAGRSVPELDGEQFLIDRASGPYIWDETGRKYVDTALGFGAVILGHADQDVNAAVKAAVDRGSMPAFAHRLEEEAATALTDACGDLTKAMFTNSGSEAVHMACRIARAVTGRGTIAKMAAGFDGWFDPVALGNAGSKEALLGNSPRPVRNGMTLTRFNDLADLENLFAENDDIAAVIYEPLLANAGCIPSTNGYLEAAQELARKHGALLIADEVLMGFRMRFGLASQGMGLKPDMATVGKAIGNGFAVAAVLGTEEVMGAAADGRAVRAGTYSGNPVAAASVLSTLTQLKTRDYAALTARGERLQHTIIDAYAKRGAAVSTTGLGVVFTLWHEGTPPATYEAAAACARPESTLALHFALRRHGLISMPQAFGRFYLSFAHDDAVIGEMEESFVEAIASLPEVTAETLS